MRYARRSGDVVRDRTAVLRCRTYATSGGSCDGFRASFWPGRAASERRSFSPASASAAAAASSRRQFGLVGERRARSTARWSRQRAPAFDESDMAHGSPRPQGGAGRERMPACDRHHSICVIPAPRGGQESAVPSSGASATLPPGRPRKLWPWRAWAPGGSGLLPPPEPESHVRGCDARAAVTRAPPDRTASHTRAVR